MADGAQSAAGTVAEGARSNPVPVTLVVGFAAGVVIGWLIGSRRD
jgi:F0F1-type ATP synthase assembly protein I